MADHTRSICILRLQAQAALRAVLAVVLVTACERQGEPGPDDLPAATAQTQPSPQGPDTPQVNRLTGVDAQDDPAGPRALPRTVELVDWIKVRPVRVVDPQRLWELHPDASRRSLLGSYSIEQVVECGYQAADDKAAAAVLLAEAATPADAFGIFQLLAGDAPRLTPADRSQRAVLGNGTDPAMLAWQGRNFVHIRFTGADSEAAREICRRLFDRVVFNLPAADAPFLVEAVPPDRRETCRIWTARSTAVLALAGPDALPPMDGALMDARLGLDGRAMLTVARVQAVEGEHPNVLWVVEYPDADSASAAERRYRQALEAPAGPLDANTIIDAARGRFLAGSWAADQESLQHLLGVLAEALDS